MALLPWKPQSGGTSVEPIDGERMTFKQFTCDKYVDILRVDTLHKGVTIKFYADLLDDTQHVSIASLLMSRKTKAKKRSETALDTIEQIWAAKEIALERYEKANKIQEQAFAEYEELLDLYLKKRFGEQENETHGIGKTGN